MGKKVLHTRLGMIILAAGKGKRMESNLTKVLHRVAGLPMLSYVLGAARKLKPAKLVVVIGHQEEQVREAFSKWEGITWVHQEEMRGTGDAVRCAAKTFLGFDGSILVLYGDIPGIRVETLRRFLMVHEASKNTITLLTTELEDPTGYGRIVAHPDGSVAKIVEDKDASEEEKEITEVNTGIGLYDPKFLFEGVKLLKPTNLQKEFYLTDLVAMARKDGRSVGRFRLKNASETLGINSREDLAEVSRFFEDEKISELLKSGVTFEDPMTTSIEPVVEIGRDTVIGRQVVIQGEAKIGENVVVETGCKVIESDVGASSVLGRNTVILKSKIGKNCSIGANTTLGK